MKFLLALLLIPLLLVPAFAESQTLPTEKGTLDVNISYDDIQPNVQTKILNLIKVKVYTKWNLK